MRSEVQELLRDYTLYVIYKDWPAHRRGVIYKGGSNRLNMIQFGILKFEPQTTSQELLHGQTLQDFNDFVASRQSRLAGVQTEIPGVLWYAVAIGALINIVLIWMLDMRFFTHMLLGGIVSFFLGVMIFLIASMDNPMKGEVSVPPASYQLVYDVLMAWDERRSGLRWRTFRICELEGMRWVRIAIRDETVRAEAGALSYLQGDIRITARPPSPLSALKSAMSNEALVRPSYTRHRDDQSRILDGRLPPVRGRR